MKHLPINNKLHNISSMSAHTTEEFRLKKGQILIYKRSDSSDNWHCRIKIRGEPYVRRSLKTDDKDEAIELAENIFFNASQKSKRGLAVNSRKFASVCRSYLSDMKRKLELGLITEKRFKNETQKVERYFIPFLGKYDTDKITDIVFSHYRDWRKVYWINGDGSKQEMMEYERNGKTIRVPKKKPAEPANRTICIEDSILRQVFEFSRKHGDITQADLPVIKSPRVKSNRRPAFDLKQYKKLYRRSMWRYKQSTHPKIKKSRQLLHDYILIMAGSGMRPTEAKTLRWCDISTFKSDDGDGNEREYIKLSVRGKGKNRDFVPQPNIKKYFDRIRQRQEEFAKEYGYTMNEDDFVFVSDQGIQIQSFKRGFDALLESLDMVHDNHGQKYAPYSLRHTYATFRLTYGKVGVYVLAQNMGTSVEMIEKHYGHLKPEDVAASLTYGQLAH